jgi:hypothetical protein
MMLAPAPAAGHHSIAGIYDRDAPVTLDAVVAEFRFVNPHPFIVVDVTNGGRRESWKVELDNRSELSAVGMNADSLKTGDRIIISGSRARDGSRGLYALRFDRKTDGFWYEQVGSSPRVGRGR